MRKWLVGLLAAGLCAASAWAETVTYTVESKSEVSVTGTAPDGASAEYASTYNTKCQLTKDNSMTLTLKGYDGATITGLTLSMKSNKSGGAGSLSATSGDAVIAAVADAPFSDESWNGAFSTEYVDVTPSVTETAVSGDIVITIAASANSLYCQSFTIEYELGEPQFSVTFNKENWFKVALGEASSVTAIPKNGIEPYTFAWESDTPELNGGTTDTLEIPATLDEGDYTVACLVTDDGGEGDAINALIGFTVEAIPVITGGSATYTVTGKSKVEASGDVPPESTAEYSQTYGTAGQATKDNSMTLTLKGYEGMTITGLTLSMKSNKSTGSGSLSVTCEDAVIASIEDSAFNVGWSDAYTQEYVDVTPEVTPTAVTGDVTITISASVNSLYCQSYTVQFEAGEPGLSVTLDKANGFTVDLGTADSITATAKNGTEPYEYVWSSDTAELNGTGETLDIPATLAEGDYTVQVEVTDAEANKASKQIGFSVVAPAVKYPITIADGIENGEITVDKTEAEEGETVTVTATPADGFALEAITVNGIAISATTFPMPAEAVEVGATFAEVKDYAELPFIAEDTPYTGPWQKATIDGLTSKGLGTDYTSGGVSVGAKFDTTGDWMQIKFDGTPDELVYAIKGNSVSETNNSIFLVQESATGAEDAWSTLATYQTEDGTLTTSQETKTNALAADSRFVRFIYDTKGAGNVGIYGVYISSGGPAVFSITLDPAEDFEVEQNAAAFVTAIPKHAAEGVVGYAWWIDGTPVDTDGEVLALATAELGPHKVVCDATDASGAEADAHVIYTVVAPAVKYAVNVALGIQNGSVATDVSEAAEGDTVTVTATAADGYRLVEIIVNNGDVAVSGNTFVMPAQDVLVTATFEEKPPVTGDVLTNDDVGSQTSSYKDWTAEKESGAVYAGLTAGGSATNPCIQLRSTSNSGIVMAKDSGQNVSSVTIEWNAQSAADRVVQVYGSTTPYSSPADLYGDAKGTLLGELTNGSGEVTVDVAAVGEFPYIGIRSKSGALYLTSVAIDFGGAAAFSIALDPAEDFEVVQGKDAAITATVRGAQGEVSYSWSVNGTPIDLAGNVYAIDSAEVGGPFTVVCEASDGVSDPVSASVSYTVVEVPPVTGDEFTLISSVDGLKDGTRVVLTDPDGTLALSATVESSVFTPTGVAPVGDVITTDNANIIWKLVDDGEGHFSLYNEEAGKYAGHAGGGTSNSGRLQDDPFPNAFSVEDGLFVVVATTADSAENYRNLQFNQNGTNPRFAYYKGTQKNLRIYAAESGPGPQPGEPAIVFGGDGEGTVGTPVNFTVTAVNVSDPQVYFDTIVTAPDDSDVTVDDIICNFPDVSFIPDCAGEYTFKFVAGVPETSDYAEGTWTVTVTGEGPGPQPGEAGITKMTIAAGKMTIEFFGEGAQVLVSDDLETWTPVNGAVSPYTIEMGSDPQYIGVR